jgi:hypothetical protein
MHIYKLVFDTEQPGKDVLIQKDVWQEVTEEGVTSMRYINGTKGVVYIGKVINPQATTDPEHPIYYKGYAYDVISTDELELEQYRVYPKGTAAHQFYGYPRNAEVPKP